MRKPKKVHGVYYRGLSIGVKFALSSGKIAHRIIGPASQVSPQDAEYQRLVWKKQVEEGTYVPVKAAKARKAAPAQRIFTCGNLWQVYRQAYENNSGPQPLAFDNRLEPSRAEV